MHMTSFAVAFKKLTDHDPLPWQERLFEDFLKNTVPAVIDLPTGLGKTMVMAVWLIARAMKAPVPTRLVYVVDRRTVVDQATDLAENLVKNWKNAGLPGKPPAVSTLRGQLADNREWSRDPSRPAIIIGTVDLIGSALLFSGHRSSYKRRPLEAGLLGQDSLLVLDEAHLSKPFEKLIGAISNEGPFQKDRDGRSHGTPMRVIRMSATSDQSTNPKPFTLQLDAVGNLAGMDAKCKVTTTRFSAKKRLSVVTAKKPMEQIAAEADKLAKEKPGSRIVVFVQTPKRVAEVREAIEKKNKQYATCIAQLTGTMRGLERDELVDTKKPLAEGDHERRVMQRFLKPENEPSQGSCFLISTSAGEVGFDLNADHLVGDEAPLDSWIQRLGRVNRRGTGNATVILVMANERDDKTSFDKACTATTTLFRKHLEGKDVSPKALAAFRRSLPPEQIDHASSPMPAMVELTDILVDAWSMTSITKPMPGRPEVGPWLRGLDDEQVQTTVAWRVELDLFGENPTPEKALQTVFAKHPIRPHESLTVNTGYLLEFLKKIPKLKDRPHHLMTTKAAVRLPRGQIAYRTLQQLADDPRLLYADSTLILPASFGGLDAAGMLDADTTPSTQRAGEADPSSLDVADRDGYEPTDADRSRLRILVERSEDGSWIPKPLSGQSIPDDVQLQSEYGKSAAFFKELKDVGFRIRLVQPIEFDAEDTPVKSLVVLAPAPPKKVKEDQPLTDHMDAVETEARRIVDALGLAKDDPTRAAVPFAAKWHDEGKKALVWQVFANNSDPEGPPLGKMAQARDPKSLRGYRHEFGSILRLKHPSRCATVDCRLPKDPDACELALHLIAAHHGAGRPHFGHAIYDPFTDAECDEIHTESIRRFARLQRKYGWWRLAWLENLLRCADALASADDDATAIDEVEGGE